MPTHRGLAPDDFRRANFDPRDAHCNNWRPRDAFDQPFVSRVPKPFFMGCDAASGG